MAARGSRNLSGRTEKIGDEAELRQVRRQALQVHIKSTLAAAGLTLVVYVLPLS